MDAPGDSRADGPRVAVLAPSPVLTITVEATPSSDDEIHLHAGGQGFWVARMGAVLDAEVTLCSVLGGESGQVLGALIASSGVRLRAVPGAGPNGAYVHDRRSGERRPVAAVPSPRLERHEVDELFGAMASASLTSGVAVLAGTEHEEVLPADVYRRLAADLRGNGVPVIADLTGEQLDAALAGGLDLLKLSHEELAAIAGEPVTTPARVVQEMERLQERGAESVLISRADRAAFAKVGEELVELSGPRFDPLDHHGAGDSMVAALAVGIARGYPLAQALRMAVAAAALNVTRRGLGSGQRADIERLADAVAVRPGRGNWSASP